MPDEPAMGGYQLMVANEVFRGRFRKSFERPSRSSPDAVTRVSRSTCTAQNYRFRKGHQIMVQVQSTWFPLIDRNPQTFVPNIFQAKATDYRAATQRVFRTTRYPATSPCRS